MTTAPLAPAVSSRDRAFSGWLDAFRALAAFAVLYSHCRTSFLWSVSPGMVLSIPSRVMYFLSGFGEEAVIVFFVLSGYLVGGTVIRSVRERRWSWRRYLLQRGTRLYVVLIPALFLTLAWDTGESVVSQDLVPNDDTAVAIIDSATIRASTTPVIFLGNAAFLQKIAVTTFGSNTPLWSLTNEFWYYLIFPLAWIAVAQPGQKASVRAVGLALAAGILVLVGSKIALYFSIWLLGALVAGLPEVAALRLVWPRRLALGVTGAAVVGTLLVSGVSRWGWTPFVTDAPIAVAFAALLYSMKHDRTAVRFPALRGAAGFFADFSYTLYLVHLPILIFLRACLTYEVAWLPVPASWAKLLGIMVAVSAYAYVVSLVTERQTERLRRWLERRVLPAKGAT